MTESADGMRAEPSGGSPGGVGPPERWIGPLETADSEAVWRLAESCFGESWSRSLFEEAIADRKTRLWVLGAGPAEVVGFLLARRVLDLVDLDLLGVAPSRRRGGLAGRLLDALLEAETAAGAAEIRLELRRSNRAAQALYRSRGFVVVGERSRYYPDGEDAILWTRRSDAVKEGGAV